MDAFDQYLYDELVSQYRSSELSQDEYEELYYRFCSLDHLREVKPYLFAMRFLGLGISPEPQAVMSELEEALADGDALLSGLYHDLSLFSEDLTPAEREEHLASLQNMMSAGYGNAYLKGRSHVAQATRKKQPAPPPSPAPKKQPAPAQNPIHVNKFIFACGEFQGQSFAAGEIDYLHALAYIDPLKANKHITVQSQIFLKDKPFSKVFSCEFDLSPETTWFKTNGWGNVDRNCYRTNEYTWVMNIVGEKEYRQKFWMYDGTIDRTGPRVKEVGLFNSKYSGALEEDRNRCAVLFSAEKMECLYFKFTIEPPLRTMCVQIHIHLEYLEENTVLYHDSVLMQVQENWVSFWTGWGYQKPGNWKKGLYHYTVRIGENPEYTGTFTVM